MDVAIAFLPIVLTVIGIWWLSEDETWNNC
jgi:hypothetical protein